MSEALSNLAVGTLVIFGGYTDLQGAEPVFDEGVELEITETTDDGGYVVKDEDGNTDTIFPEEVSEVVEDEEPLDWKEVKKGKTVDVVDADGETVATGEITAKTTANVTIDGTKYAKKDFDFFLPQEDEEEAEGESEGEADGGGDEELTLDQITKGMEVEVVDNDDNVVVTGKVASVTKTSVKIGRKSYPIKEFGFFLPQAEAEQESEQEAEGEDGSDELTLDQIEKGMEIEVVNDKDEVVATGKVASVTKTSVKIGRKSYAAKDHGFFPPIAEGEQVEGDTEAEAEGDAEQVTEVTLSQIKKGDSIEVVNDKDEVVAEGKVESVTKTGIKIAKKLYKEADFAFYPLEQEQAQEEPAKGKGKGTAKTKDTELTVVDTESVAAILADQDALEAAKDIVETIEESYFNLGGLLAHIYTEELYTQAGYEGNKAFDRYVAEELGIEYRKAMYLIKIYTHFSNLGVDETRLAEIGWSKAKELVGIATEDNFDELVDFANEHSRDELKDYIKTTFIDAGDDTGSGNATAGRAKKTTFKFSAFEDQANVITEAIEKAKDQHGITDDSEAMIAVFTEWAQLVEGIDIPLEVAQQNFEARYGVSLEVKEAKAAPAKTAKTPAKNAKTPAKGAAKGGTRSRKKS